MPCATIADLLTANAPATPAANQTATAAQNAVNQTALAVPTAAKTPANAYAKLADNQTAFV